MTKPLVLILCTGNSARSQMAEAFLRRAAGDILEVASAGSNPSGQVHPRALEVMAEAGLDLSTHRSKHMREFLDKNIAVVITVCGNADEQCPAFPGQRARYHWGFNDPAAATGSPEEILTEFRRIRDQIQLVFEAYAVGCRQGAND